MFTAIEIPHLAKGQKIADYKKIFLASTATLKDEQQRACLPIYVHRTEGEKQLAYSAAAKTTLTLAFKFLEDFIDGSPCIFTESTNFFAMKPKHDQSMDAIRSYYFELLEVSTRAEISRDVFLKRFFTNIPGGKKLFDDSKAKIKNDMSVDDVMNLFKELIPKLEKKVSGKESPSIKDEPFVFPIQNKEEDSVMPRWAKDLHNEVNQLRAKFASSESGFGDDEEVNAEHSMFAFGKSGNDYKGKDKSSGCNICGKQGHDPQSCFKRECSKCHGKGHDADVCPSFKRQQKSHASAARRSR
jgi:hypothetical protein